MSKPVLDEAMQTFSIYILYTVCLLMDTKFYEMMQKTFPYFTYTNKKICFTFLRLIGLVITVSKDR